MSMVRAHEDGASDSRSIEKRMAVANSARASRLFRTAYYPTVGVLLRVAIVREIPRPVDENVGLRDDGVTLRTAFKIP